MILLTRPFDFFVPDLHWRDEAKAFPGKSADEVLPLAVVTDGLSHAIDPAGQVGFRNNAPAPHRRDEVVLADHAVAIFDQVDQNIENLRLNRNNRAACAQLAALAIERIIVK